MSTTTYLYRIYDRRLASAEASGREGLLGAVVGFLGRWIPQQGSALDVGWGYGQFIRHVSTVLLGIPGEE